MWLNVVKKIISIAIEEKKRNQKNVNLVISFGVE